MLATVVSYSAAGVGTADRGRARRRRAPVHPDPARRPQQRSASRAGGRRPRGAAGRGHRQQPAAQGGPGVHRHPGRRRSRAAAPVGHARPAARRRRHADDQRHQPGVHRTRDDVHPAGATKSARWQRLSRRRPTCTRTGARSSRPTRPICSARACDADDPRVVAAAQPRPSAQRQGTQRGVQLPGHHQVPQRQGAVPGERPDPRPGARRDPFGRRAFDAAGGLRAVGAQRSRRPRPIEGQSWSGARRKPRTPCSRRRCGSRCSTTESPT